MANQNVIFRYNNNDIFIYSARKGIAANDLSLLEFNSQSVFEKLLGRPPSSTRPISLLIDHVFLAKQINQLLHDER